MESLRHIIEKHGYVFISRHEPELTTLEAISLLGSVITLKGFSATQELRPRATFSATPNTYSGNFGVGEFPMHTDLAQWAIPPRYFVLRCINGSSKVKTRLFDGKVIINDLGATLLRRTLVQPRRVLNNDKQLLRLLDYVENSDATILRWDNIFLCPASPNSQTSHSQAREYINSIVPTDFVLLELGDTLIIDNWRMFHGRSLVPDDVTYRHIDRVYLGDLH